MKIENALQINCSEIALYLYGEYFAIHDYMDEAGCATDFIVDLFKLDPEEMKQIVNDLYLCEDFGGGGFHYEDFCNTINFAYYLKKYPEMLENIRKIFKIKKGDNEKLIKLAFWVINDWRIFLDEEDAIYSVSLLDENVIPIPEKLFHDETIWYNSGLLFEILKRRENANKINAGRISTQKRLCNNKTKPKRNKKIRTKDSKNMAVT